jgi:hypothetical protein
MTTLQKPLYFAVRMNCRKYASKVGSHISAIASLELGPPAILKTVRTMKRWRETMIGLQRVTGLARNGIEARVTESAPHLRRAHHNSARRHSGFN